jgi:protein gp37
VAHTQTESSENTQEMLTSSRIEWTGSTWNPVTGCDKVSAGCEHCYAERMARRLQGMGVAKYKNGFRVTLHPEVLEAPLAWKKPQVIFVNSMSDLFHPGVPIDFVHSVFDIMKRADWHIFQVLTKRSRRLKRFQHQFPWPDNVWMGVTVESQHYTYRIDDLRATNAAVRFLSLEPLLGPIPDLNLLGVGWVVVGGESGPGARLMKKEWVEDIQQHCHRQGVPFFFKQWGGVNRKKTGRRLNGRTYEELPRVHYPIRQLSLV